MPEPTTTVAREPEERDDWYDGGEELPPRPHRRLLTPLTGGLAAVLLAGVGFIAGVEVQKDQGAPATAAASAGARTAFGGAGLPGSAGGAAGAGRPTIGTVSSAHGSVLYVKDSSGITVRVKTTRASKVFRTAGSTVRRVHPGDTVIVQGSTAKDGTVRATRVSATAAGASPAGGGFPGGGFGGGRFSGGGSTGTAGPAGG